MSTFVAIQAYKRHKSTIFYPSMPQLKKILQLVLSLAFAAVLFWLVYRKMDITQLKGALAGGLNYQWIGLFVLMGIVSNIARGLRWHQLLTLVCPTVRRSTTVLAVFVSYAANILFPRAGEVVRCGILVKKDQASFSKSFGTVITERLFDAILLFFIALAAILLQLGFFRQFFAEHPESLTKWVHLFTSVWLWVVLLGLIGLIIVLNNQLRKSRFYDSIKGFMKRLGEGMATIRSVRQPVLFLFYSVLIWVCYIGMFYIGIYFFQFKINLGFLPLLSAFIMGSLGVIAPVQGGIGAYHFMVIYTLTFYGLSSTEAGVFALVIHGLQTIVSLLTGLFAWIGISLIPKKTGTPNL
jgi:glycosyltransferase 2 family protein